MRASGPRSALDQAVDDETVDEPGGAGLRQAQNGSEGVLRDATVSVLERAVAA